MSRNSWGPPLFLGVFVVQFYVVSAYGSEPNEGLFTAAGWIAVVAMAGGLAAFRPRPLAGWVLVLAASILYLVGDAVLASLTDESPVVAFPSTADWIYLSMYPVLIVGLLIIGEVRPAGTRVRFDRSRLVDVGILGLVAAGTIGALYGTAAATNEFLSGSAQWVATAYPAFDVALLCAVAWIALPSSSGRRPSGASTFLALAITAIVVGNTVYNVGIADFVAARGGVAEAGWLTFTVLLAVAALRPDADRPGAAASAPIGWARARRTRTAVLATACIGGPLAVAIWADGADLRFTWFAYGAAAVALVVRQARGVRVVSGSTFATADTQRATTAATAAASA